MEEKMPDSLVRNLIDFSTNRGHVYGFLSRCYEVEVNADFAEQVAEHFSFTSDDAKLSESLKAMKADLADRSDEHLEKLAVVFNRIFFGMGPRTAQKAFPYESVYTSADGLLMQDAYSQAVATYREQRLEKNPEFPEPEDHLAVELAFMKSLSDRCIAALEAGEGREAERLFCEQSTFLAQHLLTWVGSFVADAKGSAEDGFYWHLADFTEGFLRADAAALAEVIS